MNSHVRSFQKLDGENEDLTDFKKTKWKFVQIQVLSMLV
jgi:hypothetical protein